MCVAVVVLVVLVGSLAPSLMQFRKPVPASEYLLAYMNAELPLLLKEVRSTTVNLNRLVESARDGVEHAAVLLYAAGTLGAPCNGPMRQCGVRDGRCWST